MRDHEPYSPLSTYLAQVPISRDEDESPVGPDKSVTAVTAVTNTLPVTDVTAVTDKSGPIEPVAGKADVAGNVSPPSQVDVPGALTPASPGQTDRVAAALTKARAGSVIPPEQRAALGRCGHCEWHPATQGHAPDCKRNAS